MRTPSPESHHLKTLSSDLPNDTAHDTPSPPESDTSPQAWLFLLSCFILEALIWGLPFSYGVFQVYYSSHPPFADSKAGVAAIGTVQTGLMYLFEVVVAVVMQRWRWVRRPGMCVAAVLMVGSLVAASFCDSVAGLIATQGVMYALSGEVLYFPAMAYVDEWFVRRKGMAFGIMWAGTGSRGVVVPFLLHWLLNAYGFRTALRVWAIVLAIGLTPCLFFVKGRLPHTASTPLQLRDLSFLKDPAFWLFELGALFQSFAFFLPALWIPSFAMAIGFPTFSGPLALALINLATCAGAILVGVLVDRLHITTVLLICTIGQMVAIFVFWGIVSSQPTLYPFALVWGLFGCGYSAAWTGFAPAMEGRDPDSRVDVGLVLALMAAGRGIGAVISGPLSEKLLQVEWKSHAGLAYGTDYGVLIVFSGVFAMAGGVGCLVRFLRKT